jgi:hypothetical protein
MKFIREIMPLILTPTPYYLPSSLNYYKVAGVQNSEVDENLHQSTWNHNILYADKSSKAEQLILRAFLYKQKIRKRRAVEN